MIMISRTTNVGKSHRSVPANPPVCNEQRPGHEGDEFSVGAPYDRCPGKTCVVIRFGNETSYVRGYVIVCPEGETACKTSWNEIVIGMSRKLRSM